MDKTVESAEAAVADVADGATVVVGGFGVLQGWPSDLLGALRARGLRELTLVCNTPGKGPLSAQPLAEAGCVRRLVASFAAYPHVSTPFEDAIRAGRIELELVPQGILAERLRAGGAGIPAFYTSVGADTPLAAGKERRVFADRVHVLEEAIRADVALLRAALADRHGNVVYRGAARSFHPVAASAARCTIVEADEVVAPGTFEPSAVHTPGPLVDRVVRTTSRLDAGDIRALRRDHGRVVASEPRPSLGGLPPDLMALRVARMLGRGEVVNLGLGLPTLVADHLGPDHEVTLHAENGLVGYGPAVDEASIDPDVHDAAGRFVALRPGAAVCDSVAAHAMARAGRVTTVVLGAFEVSERGDLANWQLAGCGKGGVGGAMDLVSGAARVIALTFHTATDGHSKLVRRCRHPLTRAGCVREVVTDLARITVEPEGFVLRELAPGVPLEVVRRRTDAALRVAQDVSVMDLG